VTQEKKKEKEFCPSSEEQQQEKQQEASRVNMALVFRNYLQHTLEIPLNQANALMNEGIEAIEDLEGYSDEDIIHLVNNCRKTHRPPQPGPAAGAAALAVWQATRPGIHISDKSLLRFRQMAYYAKHLDTTDRFFIPAEATLDRLKELWEWRQNELNKEATQELKEPEPLKHENKARRTLEALDHYLKSKRGVSGVPLAYLVREEEEPGPDAGYGQPTITDDLVNRAPHGNGNVNYVADNRYLWAIIRRMTQDGFAWTWVSDQDKHENGRKAYLQLKEHFLGKAMKGKIKAAADKVIANTMFTGYKGFSLDAYAAKFRDAYTDLTGPGGEDIAEERKVTSFLANITDPKMLVAKAMILASDELSNSLDSAISYVTNFQTQTDGQETKMNRNVAGYEGKTPRGGGKKRKGKGQDENEESPEDQGEEEDYYEEEDDYTRYYPPEEWFELTWAEKQEVFAAREEKRRKLEDSGDYDEDLDEVDENEAEAEEEEGEEVNEVEAPQQNS
jgi:hypothetical protein